MNRACGGFRSYGWKRNLDTSGDDLIRDFFVPALRLAQKYDRGVGYFSSGWLKAAAQGMAEFAGQGGRARWVTSPILSQEDWNALQAGEAAKVDPILKAAILKNLETLAAALSRDVMSALAWMVADEVLSFRLALPRRKLEQGDFHDKFGILTDTHGDRISFNGSYNDSIHGLRNYESIKLFYSWEPALEEFVRSDSARFERLWNNEDPNVEVYTLPDAAREQILQLRTCPRPYPRSA